MRKTNSNIDKPIYLAPTTEQSLKLADAEKRKQMLTQINDLMLSGKAELDDQGIATFGKLDDAKKDALVKQGDTMFVNTWVGCQWDIFCKHGGINMNTFYEQWELLFKGINKFFDSNLKLRSEKESYLPRMDWNK